MCRTGRRIKRRRRRRRRNMRRADVPLASYRRGRTVVSACTVRDRLFTHPRCERDNSRRNRTRKWYLRWWPGKMAYAAWGEKRTEGCNDKQLTLKYLFEQTEWVGRNGKGARFWLIFIVRCSQLGTTCPNLILHTSPRTTLHQRST